jgi:hypothetical protein
MEIANKASEKQITVLMMQLIAEWLELLGYLGVKKGFNLL